MLSAVVVVMVIFIWLNELAHLHEVYFTYDYKGVQGNITTPLELHHAIHADKSVDLERLELYAHNKP